mmetsp:Transcript_146645/g.468415  ORF Transcript_146645/g.468415 Transcript_146645/m.468415 type:complete len:325 (-) Transcript_146645:3-977(-)
MLLPPLRAPALQHEGFHAWLAGADEVDERHPLDGPPAHEQAHIVCPTVEWVCVEGRPTLVSDVLARLTTQDFRRHYDRTGVRRQPTGDASLGIVIGGVVADAQAVIESLCRAVKRHMLVDVDYCARCAILALRACCGHLLLGGETGLHEEAVLDLSEALQHTHAILGARHAQRVRRVDLCVVASITRRRMPLLFPCRPIILAGHVELPLGPDLGTHRCHRVARLQQRHGLVLRRLPGAGLRVGTGAGRRAPRRGRQGAAHEGRQQQPTRNPSGADGRHHGKFERQCTEDGSARPTDAQPPRCTCRGGGESGAGQTKSDVALSRD